MTDHNLPADEAHGAHAHDSHEHDAHDEDSHGSTQLYMSVFFALCILTAISFGSYYAFHDMPKVSWAVMMAVSCMKALLVIMFFMHLIWEANWKYVLTFPAMFMSIFLMLMLVPDVGRRMYYYSYERMLHAADPVVGDAHTDHTPEPMLRKPGDKVPGQHSDHAPATNGAPATNSTPAASGAPTTNGAAQPAAEPAKTSSPATPPPPAPLDSKSAEPATNGATPKASASDEKSS